MDQSTRNLHSIYTSVTGETSDSETDSSSSTSVSSVAPDGSETGHGDSPPETYTCPNCHETLERTSVFWHVHHFVKCELPDEQAHTLSEEQWDKVRARFSQMSNESYGGLVTSQPEGKKVNYSEIGIFLLWILGPGSGFLTTWFVFDSYGRSGATFSLPLLTHLFLIMLLVSTTHVYIFKDGPIQPLPWTATASKLGYVALGLLSIPSGLYLGWLPIALDFGRLSMTSGVVFMLSLSLTVLLAYRTVEDTISVSRIEETVVIAALTVFPVYLLAHLLGFVGPAQLTVTSRADYGLLVCVFVLLALTSLSVSAKVT
jgi:hypothetical protein